MSVVSECSYIATMEQVMRDVVGETEVATADVFATHDLPLYGMVRYHLGWADADFHPVEADPGKRIRPLVCLLSCAASGGDPGRAVAAAAAIELLHNFTLVHDDIQDRSETRRHRRTVWSVWGGSQAINAGDGLFALSQIALLRSVDHGVDPLKIIDVMRRFNEATLRIVEGQVLDLGFESRWDITVDDYLRMIRGKTAAIVAFAAWSGAYLGGADVARAERFRAFGRALGLGFQVRDDLLGIWGESSVTGKPAADDVRRRKKSLPIIALAAVATPDERAELQRIYAEPLVSETAVDRVLALLDRYQIAHEVQSVVDRFHDDARRELDSAARDNAAAGELRALLDRLATRAF